MNHSLGLRAIALGALALGYGTNAFASRDFRAAKLDLRADRAEITRQLFEGPRLPRNPDFELDGDELQKFHDAVKALEKELKEGRRDGESEEKFAERLKPLRKAANDAARPVIVSILEQLGPQGGRQLLIQASSTEIAIVYANKVGDKLEPVAKAVVQLEVKEGEVRSFRIAVYRRNAEKKKD
jgi:hypothetical protein